MEIIVKNRQQAKKDSYKVKDKTIAIISINTPCDELNKFNRCALIRRVLYLVFDDIEYDFEKGIFMSEIDAQKVSEFVYWAQKANIDELWVHCDAGISRSAGVAGAIIQYLEGDNSKIFLNPNYCPNTWCYKLTLKALKENKNAKNK